MRITEPEIGKIMRIQKFLSHAGICSRREGEKYIKKGLVTLNGIKLLNPATEIDTASDIVCVKGERVKLNKKFLYIVLNKPTGYITTCKQAGKKIILDLVDLKERVYPVGRLDKNSSGLIILTNDGRIHHRLSHPSFDHEKEYIVTLLSPISDKSLKKLADGVILAGVRTRPAKIKREGKNSFNIILKEGKKRQIRRMVRSVENKVDKLTRIRVANIKIGSLKPGVWRFFNKIEQKKLLDQLGL
jgi:23S rRNA pseudouridine2605 synthase/23S rRNA pseudouridine2604 synthase